MPNQVFKFDLDKSSDLEFKVIIDGVSSESVNSILFRFIITDPDTNLGIIIPAKKESGSDMVEVSIPENPPSITKDKRYSGVLEAIVGNIVLKPAEIDLEFEKSLVVEAVEVKAAEPEKSQQSTPKKEEKEVVSQGPGAAPKEKQADRRIDFSAFENAIRSGVAKKTQAQKVIQETSKSTTNASPVLFQKLKPQSEQIASKPTAAVIENRVPDRKQAPKKEEPYIVLEFVQEAKPKKKKPEAPVPLELAKLDTLMESLFD